MLFRLGASACLLVLINIDATKMSHGFSINKSGASLKHLRLALFMLPADVCCYQRTASADSSFNLSSLKMNSSLICEQNTDPVEGREQKSVHISVLSARRI